MTRKGGTEEGSGNGAPERPEAPANVVSGGRSSGQDLGLCRAAGPPPRGISTRPFPRPASHAPAATCSVLGGKPLPAPTAPSSPPPHNRVHWPRGPGVRPTGTCYWRLSLNQVKGWGARRGLASKGSDFLLLILLFDLHLERLIYRNQSFHHGLLSGFCCFQDA